MHKRYGNRVEFVAVYVREAHPTNGWREVGNDLVGIKVKQPEVRAERVKVARDCCTCLDIKIPVVVDEMDDRVGHAYSGMPDRLFLIDRDGRVVYKSGRGPFGFKPAEMEQSLIMLQLDRQKKVASAPTKSAARRQPAGAAASRSPLSPPGRGAGGEGRARTHIAKKAP